MSTKLENLKTMQSIDWINFAAKILFVRSPTYSFTTALHYRKCKHLTILEFLNVTSYHSSCMIDALSAEPLKYASGTTQNTADSLIQWLRELVRLKAYYHQLLQVINSLAAIYDKNFQKLYCWISIQQT